MSLEAHTVEQCEYNMLNRPTLVARSVETQRPPRRNDQRRQSERPKYTDRNRREERRYLNHRNYNGSKEEEQEEEEYRSNRDYSKSDRRY